MSHVELRPNPGNVECEIFNPQTTKWAQVKDAVMQVERRAFEPNHAEKEEDVQKWFEDEGNVIVFLKSAQGSLLGYALFFHPESSGIPDDVKGGKIKEGETAYGASIAVLPQFQGKQLLGPLGLAAHTELKRRGYKYIEGHATVGHGWANHIEVENGDRILETREVQRAPYGLQRFYRMAL